MMQPTRPRLSRACRWELRFALWGRRLSGRLRHLRAIGRYQQLLARQGFASAWVAVARGLALFLGIFSLLNILGEWRAPNFDASLWWIDTRPLPHSLSQLLLGAAGVLLLAYGLRPDIAGWRRMLTRAALITLALFTLLNSISFYALSIDGLIHPQLPVPLSLVWCGVLLLILCAVGMEPAPVPRAGRLLTATTLLACLLGFPVAQIYFFGMTDYTRPADVIVVFGARAYADGTPSSALADRVRTACQLYREGVAPRLLFSGGPGDGRVHETEAMRRMALREGVPDSAILLDPAGVDTQATVAHTVPCFEALGVERVIVVSHFFHLPRIKMAYQRAGWEVYTVPAHKPLLHTQVPFLVVREIVAQWVYYLRPLLG